MLVIPDLSLVTQLKSYKNTKGDYGKKVEQKIGAPPGGPPIFISLSSKK